MESTPKGNFRQGISGRACCNSPMVSPSTAKDHLWDHRRGVPAPAKRQLGPPPPHPPMRCSSSMTRAAAAHLGQAWPKHLAGAPDRFTEPQMRCDGQPMAASSVRKGNTQTNYKGTPRIINSTPMANSANEWALSATGPGEFGMARIAWRWIQGQSLCRRPGNNRIQVFTRMARLLGQVGPRFGRPSGIVIEQAMIMNLCQPKTPNSKSRRTGYGHNSRLGRRRHPHRQPERRVVGPDFIPDARLHLGNHGAQRREGVWPTARGAVYSAEVKQERRL